MAMGRRCSRRLILVRVVDAAEELAVLQALDSSSAGGDAKAAPVRDNLISTVCRIASAHEYSSQIVYADEFLASRSRGAVDHGAVDHGDADRRHGRELAIVPLAGVDRQTVLLAERLSNGSALLELARDHELLAQFERALILFSASTPADEVCQTLARLSQQDISFSVLLVDNSDSGRLSILKSLLFPTIDIRDVDQIGSLFAQASADVDGTTTASVAPEQSRRVLLLSGHGNSVDLGGRGIVICPRGESKAHEDMSGRYPCFADGCCFRQPLFGRSPNSSEGLIDPASFGHPVVLLLGCGTFPLGDMPFDRSSTILWRMAGSDTLAAVATLGAFYHDLNVETALLALLLDGHELGEAVRIFNAWHRGAYGRTSPAIEGYGPLVAVGHPCLRLNSSLVRELGSTSEGERSAIRIPSDAGRFPCNGPALFRIRSTSDDPARALHVQSPFKGAAVSLALPPRDDERSVIVSLHSGAGAASGQDRPTELLAFARQTFELDLATLRESLSHLAFWRLLLGYTTSPMASALGQDGERLVAHLNSLELEPILLGYLSARPFATDAVLPTSSTIAAHKLVMSRLRTWQRLLLEAACLYVQRTGGFLFHLWQTFYDRRGDGRDECCPICLRETVDLLYCSHLDPSDLHRVIHCPVCGVIGELPSAVTLRGRGPIGACRGDGTLAVEFELRTEGPAPVIGFVTLIRESWFHSSHDTAEPIEMIVEPGCKRTFSVVLSISSGLQPGLYPLTLVGVMNGGLVQLRYHVSILDPIRPGEGAHPHE